MVGDVTGCSEGWVVYINFDAFVVRDGVVAHYRDSCVPLVDLVCLENRVDLENREKQREASDRLPSPRG